MQDQVILELTIFTIVFLINLFVVVFTSIRRNDTVEADDLLFFGFFINFCISALVALAKFYLIIPILIGLFLWGFTSLTVYIARKSKMWGNHNE